MMSTAGPFSGSGPPSRNGALPGVPGPGQPAPSNLVPGRPSGAPTSLRPSVPLQRPIVSTNGFQSILPVCADEWLGSHTELVLPIGSVMWLLLNGWEENEWHYLLMKFSTFGKIARGPSHPSLYKTVFSLLMISILLCTSHHPWKQCFPKLGTPDASKSLA